MERAKEKGLVFNSSKFQIKKSSVSFFGNLYTAEGIRPDPDKVQDIRQMPTPQNKEDTKRFLGMLTYLSQFIPQLADKAHTLRSLIKKDIPWTWDALKREISEDACFRYYDRNDDINLEVDASQKGLGCALIQKRQTSSIWVKNIDRLSVKIQ